MLKKMAGKPKETMRLMHRGLSKLITELQFNMKHRARKIFEFHLACWAKVISAKRTTAEMGLLHFRS